MTHVCISNLPIIGSDNGLSPGQRQAIIWTKAGILLIGPLGTNFSEIVIVILTFSFMKMHFKMSSVKWWSFCLSLNVLTHWYSLAQNGWHFSDYMFQYILMTENLGILIQIWLKFVPRDLTLSNLYMVLPLFFIRFAACTGGIWVTFIERLDFKIGTKWFAWEIEYMHLFKSNMSSFYVQSYVPWHFCWRFIAYST